MKNQIFLQARLGSTRLSNKVLLKICNKSIIEFMVERLSSISDIDKIVLVTGPKEINEQLVDEAKNLNIDFFCGNQENILDRFYNAALMFKPDRIIRVTGDCPLIDPHLIKKGLQIFNSNTFEILSNVRKRTYPDGLDFEILTRNILTKAWTDKFNEFTNRQTFYETVLHPTKYLLENNTLHHYDLLNNENLSNIRLTLDYPEDYTLLSLIAENLYPNNKFFGLDEIMKFIKNNKNILHINKQFIKTDYGIQVQK